MVPTAAMLGARQKSKSRVNTLAQNTAATRHHAHCTVIHGKNLAMRSYMAVIFKNHPVWKSHDSTKKTGLYEILWLSLFHICAQSRLPDKGSAIK